MRLKRKQKHKNFSEKFFDRFRQLKSLVLSSPEKKISVVNPSFLIVGLGNPGAKYHKTRHNIGFEVVDRICDVYAIDLNRKKFDAVFGTGTISGINVVLAKPMSFMNRSGYPIRKLSEYFRISSENLIVVHDDLDLPLGKLRIKNSGGHGGHNGIRSIIDTLESPNFVRIRMGIGRPKFREEIVEYVLDRFSDEEVQALDSLIHIAGDAVETLLCEGSRAAMNDFN